MRVFSGTAMIGAALVILLDGAVVYCQSLGDVAREYRTAPRQKATRVYTNEDLNNPAQALPNAAPQKTNSESTTAKQKPKSEQGNKVVENSTEAALKEQELKKLIAESDATEAQRKSAQQKADLEAAEKERQKKAEQEAFERQRELDSQILWDGYLYRQDFRVGGCGRSSDTHNSHRRRPCGPERPPQQQNPQREQSTPGAAKKY